ncbi:hypothetical protein [Streptomyces sp. NPDC020747]|uniref:hypothetical protein n=1 Tax=Streptomyces sp. NPDC020747 TaxID=3365086 RepID=UPI0037B2834A
MIPPESGASATATELITAEHAVHGAPATDGARAAAEAREDDGIGPPPVPLVPLIPLMPLIPLVEEDALARPGHPARSPVHPVTRSPGHRAVTDRTGALVASVLLILTIVATRLIQPADRARRQSPPTLVARSAEVRPRRRRGPRHQGSSRGAGPMRRTMAESHACAPDVSAQGPVPGPGRTEPGEGVDMVA